MKKVLVLIADGTEEVEVITVVDYLRRAGIRADLTSVMDDKKIVGAHCVTIVADKHISEVNPDEYDAIYSPGGLPGAYHIRDNEQVIATYNYMKENEKIVAAICAAPIVLDRAGLLDGVDFTCYPGFEEEIKSGNHKEDLVVFDKGVMTSRGPATAALIAFELIEQLEGIEKREEIEKQTLFKLLMKNK